MSGEIKFRRATTDDLPSLRQLWSHAGFPAADLEKRFTEFQLAMRPDETIAGILALQISSGHGLIHSEFFPEYQQVNILRPGLWDRIQKLADNHGLFRLWVSDDSPFWKERGFTEAAEEVRKKLPENFSISGAVKA